MTIADIAHARMHNQYLLKELKSPVDVVRGLGAVQAQEFPWAKWALGLRCQTTDKEVTKLFNEGKILRTHALRPTWHFLAPEDIRWIQELTAPRVHAFNKYYYKKQSIDELTAKKACRALVKALRGGNYLTRLEVKRVYEAAGIQDLNPLRGGLLIMYAELEALICSGPLRGKQHTYALLDERAPQAKSLPRDKALTEFTRLFFTAHGPAQIQDLSWWSSLSVADIKKGIELAKLTGFEVDGKVYYATHQSKTRIPSPLAHLLPVYDEYFIAYKDRQAFSSPTFKLFRQPSYQDLFYNLIALDGRLVGGWKRDGKAKNDQLNIKLNPFTSLSAPQAKALQKAIERLSNFVQVPVTTRNP